MKRSLALRSPVFFIVISIFFLNLQATCAQKLIINDPKDKSITESIRSNIKGTASGAKELKINEKPVGTENAGNFMAVAILNPGKNFIKISAKYPDGSVITKQIRILRVVAYDDLKTLYNQKEHWAKPQVISLSTMGVIEGFPDNTFRPNDLITRGEFATWLARAAKLKVTKPKSDVFYDVPKEHWRAPYIKAVVDAGYLAGISKDEFGLSREIKRSNAVTAIVKAFKVPMTKNEKSVFSDVPASLQGALYINAAFRNGLIVGVSKQEKLFEPEREMKRAEVALLFSRLYSMKVSRQSLYDFDSGYTTIKYCRIGTRPSISKATATPSLLIADGIAAVKISAKVTDLQGRSDISKVWADLSPLGGPNNATMTAIQENGYELTVSPTSEIDPGEKVITIKALDKTGLETKTIVKVNIKKNI